jgi:hypothetical protein
VGFNALVKRLDKCINVGVGYVKKQIFLQGSNITCFMFHIHLRPIYWLSLVQHSPALRTGCVLENVSILQNSTDSNVINRGMFLVKRFQFTVIIKMHLIKCHLKCNSFLYSFTCAAKPGSLFPNILHHNQKQDGNCNHAISHVQVRRLASDKLHVLCHQHMHMSDMNFFTNGWVC